MHIRLWILALTTVSGLAAAVAHADGYVITNPSIQLGEADIKDVFIGEKQFAGPTRLIPVDNGPAQDEFLSAALKIDASRYNTLWTKKSFREGINPPVVKAGDAEVIEFVRRTPGGIGYVRTQPTGVNVVKRY